VATDIIPNAFVMYGAREAMARGLTHIEERVNTIERAVIENPSLAFDLAKALVESTCKTILNERGIAFASDDDLPKLYKMVLTLIPLLPAQASRETVARRSIVRTLGGLHAALQGVCELRSNYGFASHGSDGSRAPMETIQALLAAQAADTIVGFLYRIHRSKSETGARVRLEYADNPDFNNYVDDNHELVKIFKLEYRPSEIFFAIDLEAYKDELKTFSAEPDQAPNPEGAAQHKEHE
jgi:hypothetical protein